MTDAKVETTVSTTSTRGGLFDVPTGTSIKPNFVIVVEIGADRSKRNLDIEYRWGSVTKLTVDITADKILQSVAANNSIYLRTIETLRPRLSLNVPNTAMIIFRLSDDLDWQFSHDVPPVSLGLLAAQSSTSSKNYYENAQRILPGGSPDNGNQDKCMVACFLCDGASLTQDSTANPKSFTHSINLHVDLLDRDRDGNIIRRLPIVIDPDVKNPGGSEP